MIIYEPPHAATEIPVIDLSDSFSNSLSSCPIYASAVISVADSDADSIMIAGGWNGLRIPPVFFPGEGYE